MYDTKDQDLDFEAQVVEKLTNNGELERLQNGSSTKGTLNGQPYQFIKQSGGYTIKY